MKLKHKKTHRSQLGLGIYERNSSFSLNGQADKQVNRHMNQLKDLLLARWLAVFPLYLRAIKWTGGPRAPCAAMGNGCWVAAYHYDVAALDEGG